MNHKKRLTKKESILNIDIGGNVIGSSIITGDGNTNQINFQNYILPSKENVNIRSELQTLSQHLSIIDTPYRKKIDNALEEAIDEVKKDNPNVDKVGKALDRVLEYARKAGDFVKNLEVIKPCVINIVAWLGQNWFRLLNAINIQN